MEQLDRIEKKIDILDERQDRMEMVQVSQKIILEEHTRRSTMLEDIVLPMQKKMNMVEGGLKILGAIVAVGGVLVGIADILLRLVR